MTRKKTRMQQVADWCTVVRRGGFVMDIECHDGDQSRTLRNIRFSQNENGRPTRKVVTCRDDGVERRFDRNYEIEITGVIVDGKKLG